jgi:(+)-trans-carveol dehydrogenase
MSGRLEGKVAFISGVARGQGRSHALRLAEEGADIIGFDLCGQIESAPYPMSTSQDLKETVRAVEALGRRIVVRQADVRDPDAVESVVAAGLAELGRIDIVVANAGIQSFGSAWDLPAREWHDVIDVNLSGAWRTVKAAVPSMIEAGRGGSVIMTSSFAGLHAIPNMVHYTAAKHGVTGLARAFAAELAPYSIRVNSIHPGAVRSPMTDNPDFSEYFLGRPAQDPAEVDAAMSTLFALPTSWIEMSDVSAVVAFLASDDARLITAAALPVDAGAQIPFKVPQLQQR